MPPPVPLAWRNLAHDKVRFALFASGIGFAVVLMGVQTRGRSLEDIAAQQLRG